ncbi:MAG: SH3 domain-containing protein [Candidatus Omnitrophota bacterium]
MSLVLSPRFNVLRIWLWKACGAAAVLFLAAIVAVPLCSAEDSGSAGAPDKEFPFTGEVAADGINLRADSTTTAEIICRLEKGAVVEVLSGLYGWYKVCLPDTAPSYIRADMVSPVEEVTANFTPQEPAAPRFNALKVERDRVNIRLRPDEASPIIGRVSRNEILNFTGSQNNWYRIKPIAGSYGWVHSSFIRKVQAKALPAAPLNAQSAYGKAEVDTSRPVPLEKITRSDILFPKSGTTLVSGIPCVCEGIIKPYGMVFKRPATHKLITSENKVYLLKGDRQSLNALVNRKAKVTGKTAEPVSGGRPVIEILKIEAVD